MVLIAFEALCFSVPYLGGAKHLAVTANQSDKVCVCVCVRVNIESAGYESAGRKEGNERMTE